MTRTDEPTEGPSARREEIRRGLTAVRDRIGAACAAAGRSPSEVTLVVVTKTRPAADALVLVDLGVRDLGESRDQEARPKAAAVAEALTGAGRSADLPAWHFIGRLQTNKARAVASYADLVHSVDRQDLADALGRGAAAQDRRLDCLVQVSLDGDPDRGGVPRAGLPALADRIAAHPALRLRGMMAVAPLGADPETAFAVLPDLLAVVRAADPAADVVSAGMSGDLEAAVANGATHLRVGSAVLGSRQSLQ